jgi:hypothetical protein
VKPKTLLTAFAVGFFGVAFLRNGTAGKASKQFGALLNTGVNGTAKITRRI